ncbi:phosphoribosylaminoimidazolesuccinocarboxamide synthase [Thermohalobacter berrensis]|uniref:Phosphoribosylaminoimidazole-succinocarboxamide synthase n=1 Tax=Thermohalobacter berrensis TaxID=99594 RepID=A0A419SV17_9FIRM|nr:phosphoribosylaminoimidazolesuccinocarboxamide synthase [Thermohalobacter berrensis]RKD29057.1 phosphoribosylaminoimidazolesuccinocarboxamide synthase [Thermohalobacter berrensis]
MVYEGKAKKVYKTEDEKKYIVEYKDDATAFNGVKKGTIKGKGIINNKMSALLFKILEEKGIPTHFEELISDREMIVKAVKILPIEVIVRNIAAGSLAKRLGLEEGTELKTTVLEFCYKKDELGDPMINEYHIKAIELATEEQLEKVKDYALKINDILVKFFKSKGIKLIDFKLEFGLYDGEVILADEISPDTCRLWDAETNKKLDKDRFRRDLGDVEKSYIEVLERIK